MPVEHIFGIKPWTLYEAVLPGGDISKQALESVLNYLYKTAPSAGALLSTALERDEITWRKWVIPSGEYSGTWVKRFSKLYYKHYLLRGWKLHPCISSRIGEILGKDNKGSTNYFEFATQITWHSGGFGDRGSCYWSDFRSARDAIVGEGGYGILFYDNPKAYKENMHTQGIGRCWGWPQDNCLYLFNAYGKQELPQLAKVISTKFGVSYRRIEAMVDDAYVNDDKAYAVGTEENLPKYESDVKLRFSERTDKYGDYEDEEDE